MSSFMIPNILILVAVACIAYGMYYCVQTTSKTVEGYFDARPSCGPGKSCFDARYCRMTDDFIESLPMDKRPRSKTANCPASMDWMGYPCRGYCTN